VPHWVCQTCHRPLEGDGFVHVFNVNTSLAPLGAYPRDCSPDFDLGEVQDSYIAKRELATVDEEQQMQIDEARRFLDRPIKIGFGVYHAACDPHADLNNYAFPASDRMESLVSWALFLQEKTWLGHGDTMRLLEFWWIHKAAEVPDPT